MVNPFFKSHSYWRGSPFILSPNSHCWVWDYTLTLKNEQRHLLVNFILQYNTLINYLFLHLLCSIQYELAKSSLAFLSFLSLRVISPTVKYLSLEKKTRFHHLKWRKWRTIVHWEQKSLGFTLTKSWYCDTIDGTNFKNVWKWL